MNDYESHLNDLGRQMFQQLEFLAAEANIRLSYLHGTLFGAVSL